MLLRGLPMQRAGWDEPNSDLQSTARVRGGGGYLAGLSAWSGSLPAGPREHRAERKEPWYSTRGVPGLFFFHRRLKRRRTRDPLHRPWLGAPGAEPWPKDWNARRSL